MTPWISFRRVVIAMLTAAALLRFGAAARSGVAMTGGDFYQTLPGGYVERVNPTLWNSADLAGSAAFHKDYYLYGPIQYLTLYPIAYLNSYAEIAKLLLALYSVLIFTTVVVLWRTMVAAEAGRDAGVGPAVCAVLLFAPLIVCYVQREFEIVAFLIWTLGAYAIVTGRNAAGGAAIGYVTWFKLLPVGFLPYFVLRRWWRAIAGFIVASVAVLGLAHAVFGLDSFLMLSRSRVITVESSAAHIVGAQFRPLIGSRATFYFDPRKSPGFLGRGFCADWNETNETIVSVRWALCDLNLRHAWLPSRELFWSITIAIGALFVTAFVRHERRLATHLEAKWRSIWELSLVSMATVVLVRAHFYYLIVLLFPLVALLYRYLLYRPHWTRVAALAFSYVALSAFVVPLSVTSMAIGRDAWHVYMHYNVYFYGELTLFALVLAEYWL
ncbi:MAG: DUF2029 domain-containing protein [Acidobacteria bacterium]|nr:DUF2029 domain-containing protein [Acidobacteriota bacterium]